MRSQIFSSSPPWGGWLFWNALAQAMSQQTLAPGFTSRIVVRPSAVRGSGEKTRLCEGLALLQVDLEIRPRQAVAL